MQQGYKFMSLSSADIHSKFSGEADKIVERAFKEAVDNAPCILFMDEVDGALSTASLKARSKMCIRDRRRVAQIGG